MNLDACKNEVLETKIILLEQCAELEFSYGQEQCIKMFELDRTIFYRYHKLDKLVS